MLADPFFVFDIEVLQLFKRITQVDWYLQEPLHIFESQHLYLLVLVENPHGDIGVS